MCEQILLYILCTCVKGRRDRRRNHTYQNEKEKERGRVEKEAEGVRVRLRAQAGELEYQSDGGALEDGTAEEVVDGTANGVVWTRFRAT